MKAETTADWFVSSLLLRIFSTIQPYFSNLTSKRKGKRKKLIAHKWHGMHIENGCSQARDRAIITEFRFLLSSPKVIVNLRVSFFPFLCDIVELLTVPFSSKLVTSIKRRGLNRLLVSTSQKPSFSTFSSLTRATHANVWIKFLERSLF